MIRRFRKAWRQLHLWLGLSAGLALVLLGLTGSALVFQGEIDRFLNPGLLLPVAEGPPVSPGTAKRSIEQAIPENYDLAWMSAPHQNNGVYRGYVGPADSPFALMVAIDPGSGALLGQRPVGEGLVRFLYTLHFQLHLGRTGQNLVGIIGLLALVSLISGLVLWWPGRRNVLAALTIKRRAAPFRRQRDLHQTLGFISAPVIGMIVISGIILALSQLSRPLVDRISPLGEFGRDLPVASAAGGDPVDVDEALLAARAEFPTARLTGIGFPRGEQPAYRFAFSEVSHPRQDSGRAYAWVDRHSGKIVDVRSWDRLGSGDRFLDWQVPLHNGSAFGMPGRIAVFLLGFVPLAMAITGCRVWLARRRTRRTALHHSAPRQVR